MPRKKRELWVIDCETDPFKAGRDNPLPFLWGAYRPADSFYQTFGFASLVVDFFASRPALVYAHNGGRFDFHYLREGFESESPVVVINGRIAKFHIGACEFRDSFSILPVPLSAYQKEEIDYGIFEPGEREKPENAARIEAYLKSDCVNLASLITQFFARFGRPFTQAGCAMSYYVKNYRNGIRPRQTAVQFETYKPFYYGGRVECFTSGWRELNFSVVDKNSAYPDAMMREHPSTPSAAQVSTLPSDIERCLVSLNAVSRGAFPWRAPDGSLIFPRDREARDYQVTGWELKKGLELKLVTIRKIHAVHRFYETESFKAYIEHFYAERRRSQELGDKAGDLFNKLLMNSCYGKFASDPSKYHDFVIVAPDRLAAWIGEGWQQYQPWGDGRWLMYRPQPVEKHWYYNVATAASITGYVRAQLLQDLETASDLIYCDTDSIAARGVLSLPIGQQLGEWKMELECDAYAVAGKKMYAFRSANDLYKLKRGEYKVASKGVDLTADEIIRVARGERIEYRPTVPTYSLMRAQPVLINRVVARTAKVQHV
ncbi:MAG: DNA polymerase [Candidatus Binataceae bacterium]